MGWCGHAWELVKVNCWPGGCVCLWWSSHPKDKIVCLWRGGSQLIGWKESHQTVCKKGCRLSRLQGVEPHQGRSGILGVQNPHGDHLTRLFKGNQAQIMDYSKSMKVFILDSVRASLPEIPGLKTIPDPLGLIEEAEKKLWYVKMIKSARFWKEHWICSLIATKILWQATITEQSHWIGCLWSAEWNMGQENVKIISQRDCTKWRWEHKKSGVHLHLKIRWEALKLFNWTLNTWSASTVRPGDGLLWHKRPKSHCNIWSCWQQQHSSLYKNCRKT